MPLSAAPWLYAFILAAVAGALLASGHYLAGAICAVIALVLAAAWMRWGGQYRRDRRGSIS